MTQVRINKQCALSCFRHKNGEVSGNSAFTLTGYCTCHHQHTHGLIYCGEANIRAQNTEGFDIDLAIISVHQLLWLPFDFIAKPDYSEYGPAKQLYEIF